ncbi:MAG TPA: OmpA family protein [Polyangiaceae bacterium]|nr:OmpA family protein [Polyangiaceae bacterium]
MTFRTARAGLRTALLAAGAGLVAAIPRPALAATWADARTTPHLRDLVALDRTGETGWLFGREDVAGDGVDTFGASERAIDLRSVYAARDAERFWLRAYVASDRAPDAELSVFVFVDRDDDRRTGGSAVAPEIDAAFTSDPTRGGYDTVIGMQGGTALAGVWSWDDEAGEYALVMPAPLAAVAESGVDVDPLRLFADTHGYLQASLDADALGITPSCEARLFVRSSAGDGSGDADVGLLGPCVSGDSNSNGVIDLIEPRDAAACERDEQCPARGLCIDSRCLYPSYCRTDADCRDDETCNADGICRADGGGTCSASSACEGGLVCAGGSECRACSNDDSCSGDERCAASGRCVDESSRSGSGGGDIVLAPGEQVQGGAGTCGFEPPSRRAPFAMLVGLLALALTVLLRRRRAAWLALLVLLGSRESHAQVDAERFKPAVTHDGWVNAEGSAVRHPDDAWEFGAWLNYARHPLIIADDDGLVTPLVAGRASLDLLGSVSFAKRLALGVGLPVFLQNGDAASGAGVGDLRLVPKLELVSDLEDGLGMALAAEVRAPTHGGDFSGGASSFAFFPKVILDHRFRGGIRIGANVGVILREDESFLNVTQGDELAYAVDVGYRFGGLSGRTEIGVELSGGVNLKDAGDEETALEALGFLRQVLSPDWQIAGGVGAGVLEGYGVPTWRIFIGATFTPTSHDRDYDGIPDSEDQCIEFAEDRDGVQDTDGCPEEDPDGDHDGVADDDDECPTEKETINGHDDDDGCPDAGDRRVVFDDGEFVVLDTIRFNTGSAEVHPSAHSLLDQVALTLRAYPEIEHIRIEGHTDDTGPRELNMALSQKRALSVKHYLVGRGVSPKRLVVRSYGPDRPREQGRDNAARAKNRRVEFIVE